MSGLHTSGTNSGVGSGASSGVGASSPTADTGAAVEGSLSGARVWVKDAALLQRSFEHCTYIARSQGKNFYYGMKLTPADKRQAMYAIYAWMRAVDDLADDIVENDDGDPATREAKVRRLRAFQRQTALAMDPKGGLPDDALQDTPGEVDHALLWPAVRQTFIAYSLNQRVLDQMIEGQLLDQQKNRYANLDELRDYCYHVASVVGLTCIQVWGYDAGQGEQVRQLAEHRGIALQLTNILRDVVEDAARDRVYIPQDMLAEAGFNAAGFRDWVLQQADPALLEGIEPTTRNDAGDGEQSRDAQDGGHEGSTDATPRIPAEPFAAFDKLMEAMIEHDRTWYRKASPLEDGLERSCRPTCWALMRIYERLLEKIAADPRCVLRHRVRLSKLEKGRIAMRALLKRSVG